MRLKLCAHTVNLLTFFQHVSRAILLQPDEASYIKKSYDFIVIGGGTAGSVVARRLSEHPAVDVLLIEAGRSNVDGPDVDQIQVPYFVTQIDSSFDWNFTTTPQTALQNRSISYPRGYVLGGSSSTNYMFYTRGATDEYDRLARVTKDDSWSWKRMLPYFLKSEKYLPPSDGQYMRGTVNGTFHGVAGPLLTSLPGYGSILDSRVMRTTDESVEFPFNADMNSGETLGVGWLQSTIGKGVRSSAATAFLSDEVLNRKNLDVMVGMRATRLVRSFEAHDQFQFRSVELARSRNDRPVTLVAKKEIIVSAGSIGTPQLLMLSGIGDREALEKAGVHPTLNIPDVGRNLQDHPWVPLQWLVNSNETLDDLNRDPGLLDAALMVYTRTGMGVLANNPGANHIGWFRLPSGSPVLEAYGDPSSGPLSPHYELTFGNSFLSFTQQLPETGHFMSMCVALVAPTSVGFVNISSASIFDPPSIDPGFLQTPWDIAALTEAVKAAHRFASAPAWNEFIISPYSDAASTFTDADIHTYIKKYATTFRHPIGTARMSAVDDDFGVVNSDLRVKNTTGLRIVDASVLPFIPGAHLQAPVYAIAERASDLIKMHYHIPLTY